MAKKLCELCQQAPESDMRFGVGLCKDCIELYDRAVTGDTDAANNLYDAKNYPNATELAKRNIIEFQKKRAEQASKTREEDARQQAREDKLMKSARSIGIAYEDIAMDDSNSLFSNLYEDIGKKIKGWVKTIFAVQAAIITIFSFILMGNDAFFVGLLLLVFGVLIAWMSSWLIYAFGELVDKTSANEKHTRAMLRFMMQKESDD